MANKFNGDDTYDVKKWFDDLDDAFAVFNCSESDKLVAARSLMEKTAKVWLRSARVSSYSDLKNQMLLEFGHTYTAYEVYHQLKSRTRKSDESLIHYVSCMVEIASHAPLPETDVVDIIVEGLNDNSANVAMLYAAKTVAELKELLKRYEKLFRVQTPAVQWPVVQPPAAQSKGAIPRYGTNAKQSINRTGSPSTSASGVDTSEVRCYNCFKYGHFQSACQSPKRLPNSCFICGELGHKLLKIDSA